MITDCEACDYEDCLATRLVWVPTDGGVTVNPELAVGVDCVDDARRALENHPHAAGLAVVEHAAWMDGAA
jgi:hypothetical protein